MMKISTLRQYIQNQWLKKGIWSLFLSPLSGLASIFAQHKRNAFLTHRSTTYRAPVPVIVVGNIFIGGTGKTPLTIALVKALQAQGYSPGIISRGYGVKISKEARVVNLCFPNIKTASHPSLETLASYIGDEPSLLAQYAPIAVHPKRAKAAQALLEQHPHIDVIISDDGLQHYALDRDIEIIVQDQRETGNGYMLPAGPLREPVSRLQSVDFIVTNFNQKESISASYKEKTAHTCPTHHPQFIAMYLALSEFENLVTGEKCSAEVFLQRYAHKTIYAIAGIGNPQRFYQSLTSLGVHPKSTQSFEDHHPFCAEDLSPFQQGLVLMTSKDAIKCRAFAQENYWSVNMQAFFEPSNFFEEIHHLLYSIKASTKG